MDINASVLISTCDKFSDLWDLHMEFYKKNWNGFQWKTYLVTDKPTSKHYSGIEIIVADSGMDFPMRIRFALQYIETEFVLLTLDDYFLVEKVNTADLSYLVKRAEEEHIDYLMLYNRRMTNPKKYEPIDHLHQIDLTQKYAITLYPAIWNKDFLTNSVQKDLSPWFFEPSLTKYAFEKKANCQFSHAGTFVILDVVRKGKVLYTAKRYLKRRNIEICGRECSGLAYEIKERVIDTLRWHTPKRVFRFIKRVARKLGINFYSED